MAITARERQQRAPRQDRELSEQEGRRDQVAYKKDGLEGRNERGRPRELDGPERRRDNECDQQSQDDRKGNLALPWSWRQGGQKEQLFVGLCVH
jgi:hypothetical protein